VVALAAGCDGSNGPGVDDWVSSDERIDGAGAGDTVDSLGVRMCVSENGNVYAVWYDDREGSYDVWFQTSRDGGESWQSLPVQVNHGLGEASNPDIACVGNTVFVVWEDTRDGELENKNIYFSRSDSAGTRWLEQDIRIDLDEKGKFMSIGPRVVTAGDEVHLVWADAVNGAYDIYSASSANRGSAFSAPVRVDSDEAGSAFSAFPQIEADGAGNVIIAWEDARDSRNDIYAAVSNNAGVSYSPDVRLDGGDAPGSADSFSPRLAVDDGVAYVVWHDERNGASTRDIYMNWSADGGTTWQTEAAQVESDGPGAGDSTYPSVTVVDGTAHIVWQDRRSGGFDIYYRSFTDGVARTIADEDRNDLDADPVEGNGELRLDRSIPRSSNAAGWSNSLNARIASSQEKLAVAWEDRRWDGIDLENPTQADPQGFDDLYYNYSLDLGDNWSAEDLRIDSYPRGQKFVADMSVGIIGDTIAAIWLDGRRGNMDVMFSAIDLGDEGNRAPDGVITAGDAETGL
jgi:hypothetical protein